MIHRPHRLVLLVAFVTVANAMTTSPVCAQQAAANARPALPARLGPDARAAIERIIDSARIAGLPTAPLMDKVLEGSLKGADDQRIVLAVQSLVRELGAARSVLGSTANVALLGATASALHAGISAADLRHLVRPAGDESLNANILTSALVALVDIVAKRVPPDVAATAIGDLLQRGAPEQQFVSLRSEVDQDILAGRSPEAALMDRTRAHLRQLDASPAPGHAGPPTHPPGTPDVTGASPYR